MFCLSRMETDDVIFDRFYANQRMRTNTDDCSGDCKTNTLCGLVATTSESYLACLLYTMGIDIDATDTGELELNSWYGNVHGTASAAHISLLTSLLSAIVGNFLRFV